MDTLQALSLAMGTAWTSGINLYATVAALGIAGRTEMIQLPPDLQVLTHPAVIAVACVMYLIEFFADKVPYVDNGWDVLPTFIRVPAGAILAARTFGGVREHLAHFPSPHLDAHPYCLFSRLGCLADSEVVPPGQARFAGAARSTARGQAGSAGAHWFTAARLDLGAEFCSSPSSEV